MKLTKKTNLPSTESTGALNGVLGSAIDRRTFLRRTGLALGAGAIATTLPPAMMKRSQASAAERKFVKGPVEVKRSVCTHCSVGCGVRTAYGPARSRTSIRR